MAALIFILKIAYLQYPAYEKANEVRPLFAQLVTYRAIGPNIPRAHQFSNISNI